MADTAVSSPSGKPGHGRVFGSITETIGNTPLVRLNRLPQERGIDAEILLKLEFFNPIASVKDRIGVNMIDALEASGQLKPGGTLVEPTSGNTGIALAFVAAARGYRLILVMPETMSIERRKMLAFLGAELVLTPAAQGMKRRDRQGRGDPEGDPGRGDAAAIREPGQPRDPSQHHGRGDLERHAGPARRLRRRRRHRRHHHGRRPGAEAAPAERQDRRGRAEDSPVLSGGQPGPHKIQGIGAGFIPGILDRTDRRGDHGLERDAFETARLLGARRGHPGRHLVGRGDRGGPRVASRPENQGQAHRHDHSARSPSATSRRPCSKGSDPRAGPAHAAGPALPRLDPPALPLA